MTCLTLHGVSLAAGIWAPWLIDLPGYQAHLVELPGHSLSGPLSYRASTVRGQVLSLLDVLGLAAVPVVAHSLGGRLRSGTRPPGRDGSPRWPS